MITRYALFEGSVNPPTNGSISRPCERTSGCPLDAV